MSKNNVDYWSVYRALNFKRFARSREFVDSKTGKKYVYGFIGDEYFHHSVFMQVFTGILWMSPVFVILMAATSYIQQYPIAALYAVIALIIYHFAAMYYVIKGPHLTISQSKKKGIFSLG